MPLFANFFFDIKHVAPLRKEGVFLFMKYNLQHHQQLCDFLTPVQTYLLLRDEGHSSVLFESTDYHSREDAHSVVAFDPLETLKLTRGQVESLGYAEAVQTFLSGIECAEATDKDGFLGIYGSTNFEAICGMDKDSRPHSGGHPEDCLVQYSLYRFVLIFNHFNQILDCWEFCPAGESSAMSYLLNRLSSPVPTPGQFRKRSAVTSPLTRLEYEEIVRKGVLQCHQGEVFQVVYSRQFSQEYVGDDFQVYRALRSINPSPFLFYIDDGNSRVIGSSPEAQLLVRNGMAEVHPIAGTVRRSRVESENIQAIAMLREDEKENAEHTMLLDLARNDLNRSCQASEVTHCKEVQMFSHVIHLVSKVEARLKSGIHAAQVFADTFPAGTLSGAPKLKAIELIAEHEPQSRGLYGGAVGCYGLNGDCIHAIAIRSFFSNQGCLTYQAGAGVVMDSIPSSEADEVEGKLEALAQAMDLAETL